MCPVRLCECDVLAALTRPPGRDRDAVLREALVSHYERPLQPARVIPAGPEFDGLRAVSLRHRWRA